MTHGRVVPKLGVTKKGIDKCPFDARSVRRNNVLFDNGTFLQKQRFDTSRAPIILL